MYKVYVLTNKKQYLGALLAKFSFEKKISPRLNAQVEIVVTDEHPEFTSFVGSTYLFNGKPVTYSLDDLQSFTLGRFLPPELMGYQGRALVIDPDIFATQDVTPLLEMDMHGAAIAACPKKTKKYWESSVMLLDCAKLRHWNIKNIMRALADKKTDYREFMWLMNETSVTPLDHDMWNSFDAIGSRTKILHTTNRLTQPWRTGLPIDFTIKPMPKILNIIPREPIQKLLGRYPTHYQPHPDKQVEAFFFNLLRDAIASGVVSESFVREEINKKHVRGDALEILKSLPSPALSTIKK